MSIEHVCSESLSDKRELFNLKSESNPLIIVNMELNNIDVIIDIDTWGAMSLISKDTKKKLFPSVKLHHSTVILKAYISETTLVISEFHVHVNKRTSNVLSLYWS